MHIGQTIVGKTAVLSPWFPREADNAVFVYEIIDDSGANSDLVVTVYTKNTEDQGFGAALGDTFTQRSGTNFYECDCEAVMEEMVRFNFDTSGSTAETDWVMFRMLQPSWYATADA